MRHLYYSVAETLAHELTVWEGEAASDAKVSAVQARRNIVEEIVDMACMGPLQEQERKGPEGLAKRYLPPGKASDLFLVYVASCTHRNQTAAGMTHFRRAWRKGWCKVLEFPIRSTHALCRRCHQLKTQMKHGATLQEHVVACAWRWKK